MLGSTLAAGVLALVAATGAAPAPGGPHDVATTTAVVVTSAPDGALRVTVSVAAARGGAAAAPTGTVAVLDDGAPVALLPLDGGTASLTTSALDPSVAHRLSARFAATATHAGSSSAPVEVAGPAPASGAAGAVALTIPAGLLSITSAAGQVVDLTPRGRTGRGPTTGLARVVVTDTRAGNLGFTVSATLVAGPGRRPDARSATAAAAAAAAAPTAAPTAVVLVGVRAEQVPGNGLAATDVVTARGRPPRAGGPTTAVAAYPGGLGTGSVVVTGVVVGAGLPRDGGTVRVLWTVV